MVDVTALRKADSCMDYVPSHPCAVMCVFSSGTGSYAEMERLSTTVQESLNESQQICKVSMLCLHVLTTHGVYGCN